MQAIADVSPVSDEWEIIDKLHQASKVAIPQAVEKIRHAGILHDRECEIDEMKEMVREIASGLCK